MSQDSVQAWSQRPMEKTAANCNPSERLFSIDTGKENMIEFLINWQYFQLSKWKIFSL
jgi:hypothetical protein